MKQIPYGSGHETSAVLLPGFAIRYIQCRGYFGHFHGSTTDEQRINSKRNRYPDSKVNGANMGSIWGRQDPGGPQNGPMNFAI